MSQKRPNTSVLSKQPTLEWALRQTQSNNESCSLSRDHGSLRHELVFSARRAAGWTFPPGTQDPSTGPRLCSRRSRPCYLTCGWLSRPGRGHLAEYKGLDLCSSSEPDPHQEFRGSSWLHQLCQGRPCDVSPHSPCSSCLPVPCLTCVSSLCLLPTPQFTGIWKRRVVRVWTRCTRWATLCLSSWVTPSGWTYTSSVRPCAG